MRTGVRKGKGDPISLYCYGSTNPWPCHSLKCSGEANTATETSQFLSHYILNGEKNMGDLWYIFTTWISRFLLCHCQPNPETQKSASHIEESGGSTASRIILLLLLLPGGIWSLF
jgi:hypothetical protein